MNEKVMGKVGDLAELFEQSGELEIKESDQRIATSSLTQYLNDMT